MLVIGGAGLYWQTPDSSAPAKGHAPVIIDNLKRAAGPDFADFTQGDVRDREFMLPRATTSTPSFI